MSVSQINIEPELIEQFRQGNELAFELIFHRTKGKLNGFLNKTLPISEDAESIMQEIYLKIWSNRKSVKIDRNFEIYLFAIARNLVIDVMRKRLHKQKYLEKLFLQLKQESQNNVDTLARVEYRELEQKITELIGRLPEQRQIIYKLHRMEGLTYKEIGEKLNISENTVDTQLRNALAFLRHELKRFFSILLLTSL